MYIIAGLLILLALGIFMSNGEGLGWSIVLVLLGLVMPWLLIPAIAIWLIATCKGY